MDIEQETSTKIFHLISQIICFYAQESTYFYKTNLPKKFSNQLYFHNLHKISTNKRFSIAELIQRQECSNCIRFLKQRPKILICLLPSRLIQYMFLLEMEWAKLPKLKNLSKNSYYQYYIAKHSTYMVRESPKLLLVLLRLNIGIKTHGKYYKRGLLNMILSTWLLKVVDGIQLYLQL